MKTLDAHKNELRDSTRYPYTYACDWLRMKGKAESRAEACQLYHSEEEAKQLAEKYIHYWACMNMASEYLAETE